MSLTLPSLALAVSAFLATLSASLAAPSKFTFSNPADRLAAASGPGVISYFDPNGTGWGPTATQFGKASSFSLPAMTGGDPDVMSFPACTLEQGYLFTHSAAPNGALEASALVGSYTMIFDVFYPAESDGGYRPLWQTNPANSDDADFFVDAATSGGIGINGNYRGRVTPGTWHRVAVSMRAAEGEGQARRYIDGRFEGAIGTTGSALGERFGLQPEVLLLTDEDGESRPGYLSGFYFTDRAMSGDEIAALGGPNAAGPDVPGAAAPALEPMMKRRPEAIGHRGGSYGSAPDNTLAALNKAFADGAAGVEIDTRLTADGIAVCFHDASLERTTNGTGFVDQTSLSDLQLLDAGSKFDPSFAGEKVPTVEQALNAAKGKGIVYLDIKTDGQAQALADAVNATGFPLADLWFWTPDRLDYAAEILALLPGARIFWGSPPDDWASDPDYFNNLKAGGVVGFSMGTGTGAPERDFVARAKREGFIVEVYTVNDPDGMRAAAEAGVDFIETDFPETLRALQPARTDKASGPFPADGASFNGASALLTWVPPAGTTAHRVHFGTVNPPPLIGEQTSDLYQTPELVLGTRYYWRVDEVTPGGTVTGDVWTFVTAVEPLGTILEWGLNGSLTSALGGGALTFADGENTAAQTSFETTDDVNVPHIAGQPAGFLRIPAFTSEPDGLSLTLAGVPANGGGSEVNRYSLIFDVLEPAPGPWLCFFSTLNAAGTIQDGDGEFFANGSGQLGIGALGYSPAASLPPGEWRRIIFSADLAAGNVSYYVDGVPVHSRVGVTLRDGRFGLRPSTAAPPHVRLFNDNDGEMSEVLVNAIAFVDIPLAPIQAAELGAAKAEGIFFKATPPTLGAPVITRSGNNVTVTWTAAPARLLQRSLDLTDWTDIPATAGQGTHTEVIQTGARVFFRAAE